ncbi:hypothetical protein [uncultured Aquimarina sp.]|uniref:hypothetical protein n=1 Tax=uncultured Aquimarina sp. TaxID=575652 RepID=UPI00260F3EBF|nr:hypothetical protein [uncultured Aquimarina sp.]
MNPDNENTISKDTGAQWTANWRTQHPNVVNAFLIPAVDFVEVLNEIGILDDAAAQQAQTNANNLNSKVRGYLAIDGDGTEKIIFVGTENVDGVYRDIIDGTVDGNPTTLKSSASDTTTSGIYDFTTPCPPDCDQNSPLNQQ